MSLFLEIAVLGLMIYLLKASLIAIGKVKLSPFVEEVVALLPVAMLASLVTTIAIDGAQKTDPKLYLVGVACVVLAGAVTWLRKGISAACLLGMVLLLITETHIGKV